MSRRGSAHAFARSKAPLPAMVVQSPPFARRVSGSRLPSVEVPNCALGPR